MLYYLHAVLQTQKKRREQDEGTNNTYNTSRTDRWIN